MSRTRDPDKKAGYAAELEVPPLPPALRYLWSAFRRLSSRRGSTSYGPGLISWADLDAFQRLTGVRLAPWEIEIIEALDVLYLTARADPSRKEE